MNIEKTIAYLMGLVDDCIERAVTTQTVPKLGRNTIESHLRAALQCKACPVTLEGYSPSSVAVQIQEPGQSTHEQQAQAWRAVWEVLQEVKPGFEDCYPLSGQEAAIKAIRELAAVQQGVQPTDSELEAEAGWLSATNPQSNGINREVQLMRNALNKWGSIAHPTQQGLDALHRVKSLVCLAINQPTFTSMKTALRVANKELDAAIAAQAKHGGV